LGPPPGNPELVRVCFSELVRTCFFDGKTFFSVVVPTWNRAELLRRTMGRVLQQDFRCLLRITPLMITPLLW
jgi:hypothetical protein